MLLNILAWTIIAVIGLGTLFAIGLFLYTLITEHLGVVIGFIVGVGMLFAFLWARQYLGW